MNLKNALVYLPDGTVEQVAVGDALEDDTGATVSEIEDFSDHQLLLVVTSSSGAVLRYRGVPFVGNPVFP